MKMLFSVDEFCAQTGISKATAYRLMASGRLEARKVGGRTVITAAALDAWMNSLPKYESESSHVSNR